MRMDQDTNKQYSLAHQRKSPQFDTSTNPKETVGPYALEKELGHGSWGKCFRAVNSSTNDVVSLRLLSSDFSKRELSSIQSAVSYTSSNLESDRFQPAIDASIEKPNAYVSSQFVVGENLFRLVKRTGQLPIRQSIYCVARAIEGLADAHKKSIVHGELRPSKIIVDRAGSVTIRDLAIAQVTRMRRQFATEPTLIQKLPRQHIEYLAPEILSGAGKPNLSSDLYSMGCILYFLLTGKSPYSNKTANRIVRAHHEAAIPRASRRVKGIPHSLDECLARMLAKRPADRFTSYKQCHEALREIAKSLPTDDQSTKAQWEKIVNVDQTESKSWWSAPKSIFSNRLMYSVLGLAALIGIGASIYFVVGSATATKLNVEPSGNRGIPTAEQEDSFIIRVE